MKIHKNSLIAVLALGSLLVCSTLATAQDAKESKPGKEGRKGRRDSGAMVQQRLDKLTEDLKLTDDQKPKVKEVLEEQGKKMQEMRGDSSISREDRQAKYQELRKDTEKKMKEILTPDQMEKFKKIQQEEMRKKGGDKKGDKKGEAKADSTK
jgi:protein CpxP